MTIPASTYYAVYRSLLVTTHEEISKQVLPEEVEALIELLGLLAVAHARLEKNGYREGKQYTTNQAVRAARGILDGDRSASREVMSLYAQLSRPHISLTVAILAEEDDRNSVK